MNKQHILTIYLMGFLFAFSLAIPTYINSTFLSNLVSEKNVGFVYTLASILSMIMLVWMPVALRKLGNFKITLLFLITKMIALTTIAFSSSPLLTGIVFLIYLILTTAITFNFDVFLEHFSSDDSTGNIRGTYLSARNTAWVMAPIIAGLVLTNGDYWKIYTLASFILLPIIYLLFRNFKNFEDPEYSRTPFWETLKTVWSRKNVHKIFVSNLLLKFFYSWMVIYTPIYLHQHIGFSWSTIGIIFTIMLLPFPLLEMPLGKLADDRFGEKEMLNIGFIIMGLSTAYLTFVTSTSPVVWAALLFVTRIGASMVEITTESYFFKKIKSSDTNILGFFRMTRPIAYIIGPLLASLLLVFIDIHYLFVILGTIIIVLGLGHGLKLVDTK
ncbi:MFS transporter [Patescibacteria group bacterium]|nr:MFS transporter [Patescibacteria group bacterium]